MIIIAYCISIVIDYRIEYKFLVEELPIKKLVHSNFLLISIRNFINEET